jgi:threonine dehydrogenase-like Zn-dependent dehydrogenase
VKSRSTYLSGTRDLQLVERDLTPAEDEVLVRVHAASICESDKLFYQGEPLPVDMPRFLGHEGGGTVEAVGARVHEWKPGDRVMMFGIGNGLAEYFVCKPAQLIAAPEGASMDLACLGEPLVVPMHMVYECGVTLGDTVAVFCGNFNGQVVAQGVKKSGASNVSMVEAYQGKLDLARSLGCDVVINSDEVDVQEAIMDLTGGKGVDVAIEASGYGHKDFEKWMNIATQVTRHNGILCTMGWPTVPITVHMHRWHHHALDFRVIAERHQTLHHEAVRVPRLMRPFVQGLIEVDPLVTARFPLSEIQGAFDLLDRDPSQVKVVVTP